MLTGSLLLLDAARKCSMLEGAGAGPACVGVSSEDIDRWGDPSSWLGSFGAMHPPLLAQHLRACSYEVGPGAPGANNPGCRAGPQWWQVVQVHLDSLRDPGLGKGGALAEFGTEEPGEASRREAQRRHVVEPICFEQKKGCGTTCAGACARRQEF